MVERVSQLELSELNHELMKLWLSRVPERAEGFALEFHQGEFPDADIEAIVDLLHVMNDAPREGLELEDERMTVEDVRAWQHWRAERGVLSWTLFARELATRKLAGFTEAFWHAQRPEILQQGGTGVWPQYRNKGLGRWLKAAMIDRVLHELPQVKRIRTDNANSNAPMLKINYDLGFKHYLTNSAWQVETQQVCAYLAEGIRRIDDSTKMTS
jgi:mycothiol synthase